MLNDMTTNDNNRTVGIDILKAVCAFLVVLIRYWRDIIIQNITRGDYKDYEYYLLSDKNKI